MRRQLQIKEASTGGSFTCLGERVFVVLRSHISLPVPVSFSQDMLANLAGGHMKSEKESSH